MQNQPRRSPPPLAVRHSPPPPRIGFISPGGIERAFIALLYIVLLVLVLLSFVGTFYGLGQSSAPLSIRQMLADMAANTDRLLVAVVLQLALTLAQYGARQMASADRRWWLLYLAALAVSIYYNYMAFWTPMTALVAWPVAALILIVGDIVPELVAVRHR